MPYRLDPRVRSFLLRLPLAGAAALVVWYGGLAGPWARAVAAASEVSIRVAERSPSTRLKVTDDGRIEYWRSDFSSRSGRPALDPTGVTANLVVLLALVWATPGSTTGGGLRAAVALLVLFLSQVLHAVLSVETTWAMDLGAWSEWAYPRWQRELLAGGRHFFDVALKYALPLFLWGFFSVVPRLHPGEEETSGPKPMRRNRKR